MLWAIAPRSLHVHRLWYIWNYWNYLQCMSLVAAKMVLKSRLVRFFNSNVTITWSSTSLTMVPKTFTDIPRTRSPWYASSGRPSGIGWLKYRLRRMPKTTATTANNFPTAITSCRVSTSCKSNTVHSLADWAIAWLGMQINHAIERSQRPLAWARF